VSHKVRIKISLEIVSVWCVAVPSGPTDDFALFAFYRAVTIIGGGSHELFKRNNYVNENLDDLLRFANTQFDLLDYLIWTFDWG
jgi:hypothetical protein